MIVQSYFCFLGCSAEKPKACCFIGLIKKKKKVSLCHQQYNWWVVVVEGETTPTAGHITKKKSDFSSEVRPVFSPQKTLLTSAQARQHK